MKIRSRTAFETKEGECLLRKISLYLFYSIYTAFSLTRGIAQKAKTVRQIENEVSQILDNVHSRGNVISKLYERKEKLYCTIGCIRRVIRTEFKGKSCARRSEVLYIAPVV